MKTGSRLYQAWLQHDPLGDNKRQNSNAELNAICATESSVVIRTAAEELKAALQSMLGVVVQVCEDETEACKQSSIRIGTSKLGNWSIFGVTEEEISALTPEGYLLRSTGNAGNRRLAIIGGTDSGVLYGVFHLIRLLETGHDLDGLDLRDQPRTELRMINHWDNANGSVERGYAGKSIFYTQGRFKAQLDRVRDYARLLGSVGINSVSINNVNVHENETAFILKDQLPEVAKVAELFRAYGIRTYLSVNFASPIQVGGISTADPLDAGVKAWWSDVANEIYRHIPDFGGFVVKADSEHRPGPFTYGRDHADGANMLAEALAPHSGLVIWRCFVYNCMQDWRDRSTDRARAAYDHFKPLDGKFHDNVILQIKNGPMDFQVREPVSPLFGALTKTNQLMEFQIAQEYTGQQRHLCYLVPQWKSVLDFETYAQGEGSEVKKVVDGSLFGLKYSGYAAVSNIGDDENWTGHTLAQANLYGYGRLIWNPELSAEQIADEWIRLTFGNDEQIVAVVSEMLMSSWEIYENYTAPLGVGWMVTPHSHYGPDVDGYEYSRWGTYHFADRNGIGVDRTVASGTGYSAQYHSPNKEIYDTLESCPDELLLFFHHVPYKHRLKSGKTVIQHIYDTHFDGAEQAQRLLELWNSLEGKLESATYEHVQARQTEQAEHAKHWRDVINTYFYRKSGLSDEQGRTIY